MALNTNLLLPDPSPLYGTSLWRNDGLVRKQTRISHFILLEPLHTLTTAPPPLLHYRGHVSGGPLCMSSWSSSSTLTPRLHSPMYFFLSWLSLMDLMLISTIVHHMAIDYLLGHGSISFTGCGLQILFTLPSWNECFLLAFMAYDRYVAISSPLGYSVVMSAVSAGSWWQDLGSLAPCGWADPGYLYTLIPYCGSQEIIILLGVPAVLKLACAKYTPHETVVYVCCVLMLFFLPSHHLCLISEDPDNCAPHAFCWRSAEGLCYLFLSHGSCVSLLQGCHDHLHHWPQAYHSSSRTKVVSAFCTMITPMLQPYLQPEEQGSGWCSQKLLGRCSCGVGQN